MPFRASFIVFLLPDNDMASISRLKYLVRILIVVFSVCYIGFYILLNLPSVQRRLASFVSSELEEVLGSEVAIGRVDWGLFNRIIIEDVLLKDQQGEEMLQASRLSAKFEVLPLFEKKLSISSVQFYGFKINLNKKTPDSPPNYQFVLDAFASKDTVKKEMNLDLRINSILIRRGHVAYDVLSEPKTPGKFNSSHVALDDFTASISLKAFRQDTLNAAVRRLSFKERSGFDLKRFAFQVVANNKSLSIKDFMLELPNSTLTLEGPSLKYDSLQSIPSFTDDLTYQGNLTGSVCPKDLSAFLPPLEGIDDPMSVNLRYEGKGAEMSIPEIRLYNRKYMRFMANAAIRHWQGDGQEMQLEADLSRMHIPAEGLSYLSDKLKGIIPDIVGKLGHVDLKGNVRGSDTKLKVGGLLRTASGDLEADVTMDTDKNGRRSYSGNLSGVALDLGTLTSNKEKFGHADFNVELKGFNYQGKYPESNIKGVVSSIEYSGYQYKNVTLDGIYKDGGFNGKVALNDENATLEVEGNVNTVQSVPVVNVQASVRNLRPHELNLSDKYVDSSLSLKFLADVSGRSLDDIVGQIRLDSLVLDAPEGQEYFLDNLTLNADKNNNFKELTIRSSFMNAKIQGDYSYKSLPTSVVRMLQHYLPSLALVKMDNRHRPNNFEFDFWVENTDLLEKVFYLPIRLHMPSTLKGYINDNEERIRVEGSFPQFTYNGTLYESGGLFCENPSGHLNCRARASMLMGSGAMLNLSLNADARNDSVETTVNWGNNTDVTYGGKFSAVTRFSRAEEHSPILRADIDIHPAQAVLNDTVWRIHPSHIAIDSGYVYVDNLLIERENQHLRIDGKITDRETDSCRVDLKNVNVAYVLDIVRFDDVRFDGMASGSVLLSNMLDVPSIQIGLDVQDFAMNQAILGDADIEGHWDNELGGVRLEALMKEEGISSTHVTGYVSPKQKGLDLAIEADSMNLGIIAPYVEGIFSEMDARVNGNIRLFGPFKFLDLEGDVCAMLDAKLDVLNTYFQIRNDSIHVTPGELAFKQMRIYDREGNSGYVNGYLRHNKLKNMTYRFDVDADNLLVYDSDDPGDMSLYGRVYGIGDIVVRGGNNAMNIDVSLTTGRNTTFTYVSGVTTEAASNQFITFVDKTPKRIQDMVETDFYHHSDASKKEEDEGPSMDLYINMLVEATPDAQMKVIMDPISGDYISARGTGNLQVNYYNKGNFRMFGTYAIDQGVYKLSMQEVIRKDFALQPGGMVTFSGDPYQANLDLQAVYTVNSVSLSDLSTDASLNQSTVKVNCVMNLTGSLANPTIRFDLDLPAINEEDRELVRSATSTEEQMNTQIIYLLTIGKFYPYDYADRGNQSSNATSSLAFNTLSGQLNNMLSQWTENKNWNIGANLSTGEEGWSDVEAEAILSGRLLNNRLLINGNFGYRENVLANTNFVGDFEAILLLTKNGEWRLRGYNQTNDRYFTKSTLTTQGIGLIYKKDFDKWSDLFYWFKRKWKKEKDNE